MLFITLCGPNKTHAWANRSPCYSASPPLSGNKGHAERLANVAEVTQWTANDSDLTTIHSSVNHPSIYPSNSVQSLSRVRLLVTPMDCSTPGLPVHHQLLEFAQTHDHRVSDANQPSHPLSSPSPPAFNLSQHQGLFQWVSSSHQVAKLLEFQLQHQSFQFRNSGLISFRMDWLDLLAVQGTLKSVLQHHSSKASILQRSTFFMVQPSHPYMTTGKTIALARRTFVGKGMSLFFNML